MPESKWREVFEYVVYWTVVIVVVVGVYTLVRWLLT